MQPALSASLYISAEYKFSVGISARCSAGCITNDIVNTGMKPRSVNIVLPEIAFLNSIT